MAKGSLRKENLFGKKKFGIEKLIFWVLFLSMLGSVVFVCIRLVQTWGDESKAQRDYKLMLLQCVAGLLVIFLPMVLERKWKIQIPSFMVSLYFIFLYCAIYLGEVRSFYNTVPHWDTVLHTFSGLMLGALGFVVVDWLNKSNFARVQLSPVFVGLFAFCFAVAAGAVWEIWEYAWDCTMNLNMQKYLTPEGVPLVGQAALWDTMKDIIVDTIGAFIIAVAGSISIKMRKNKENENNTVGLSSHDAEHKQEHYDIHT